MTQSPTPAQRDSGEVSTLRKSMTDLTKVVERVSSFQVDQVRPLKLLNWIGYGLLIFALFDVIEIFSGWQPFNPQWELQTLGQLIERVAVPLIGFGLVFVGGGSTRSKFERSWVKFLSWVTLVLAVLFFLSVPLGIFNTVRLYRAFTQQITTQEQQQTTRADEQIKLFKERLDQVSTPEELQAFLGRISRQGQAPKIEDPSKIEDIKDQLSAQLDNRRNQIPVQAQKALSTRRIALLKSAVKWNLSALISSVLFFSFWKGTPWARQRN